MWRHTIRKSLPPIFSSLPHFRGKGRIVLLLDRILTDLNAPDSYLTVGLVNHDTRLRLDLRLYGQKFAFYYRELEPAFIAAARKYYRPGLFLDVGGSIGLWAVALGHQAKQRGGRVLTVEPIPHHRQRLLENLRLNHLEDVVEIIPVALGERDGIVGLYTNDLGAADNAYIASDGPVQVPLTTVDRLVHERRCEPITFMKIDAEGYDTKVIEGAEQTIRQWRPVIAAEFLRERMVINGMAIDPCWNFLVRDLCYNCFRFEGKRLVPIDEPGEWENLLFLPHDFPR